MISESLTTEAFFLESFNRVFNLSMCVGVHFLSMDASKENNLTIFRNLLPKFV